MSVSQALLEHVRDRWSIENSWHWPRDTQLKEDAHRYRQSNGVQILVTLRSLAMNPQRRPAAQRFVGDHQGSGRPAP